ncbi:TetR/AcrR family transcriptional regulator [Nocardiopsis coralliicola]
MHADTAEPAKRPSSGPATRARILAAASDLFYTHGIRATSADRIIEQVGITKVTFYRHFRTKSSLVVAYLEEQAAAEREWMESVRRPGDPLGSLRALADGIGRASCSPGFRGCSFINAAAEFPDGEDPVRTTVAAHRTWLLDAFAGIAAEAGADDPAATARQLVIARDGAMVNGYLGQPSSVSGALGAAFAAIAAGRRDGRSPGA